MSLVVAMIPYSDEPVIVEADDPLWAIPKPPKPDPKAIKEPPKCGVKGCTNDAVGLPIILVLPKKGDPKPIEVQTDYFVCEAHQNPDPNAFISLKGWQALCKMISEKGWDRPHWKRTSMRFDPLPADQEGQNDSQ